MADLSFYMEGNAQDELNYIDENKKAVSILNSVYGETVRSRNKTESITNEEIKPIPIIIDT